MSGIREPLPPIPPSLPNCRHRQAVRSGGGFRVQFDETLTVRFPVTLNSYKTAWCQISRMPVHDGVPATAFSVRANWFFRAMVTAFRSGTGAIRCSRQNRAKRS